MLKYTSEFQGRRAHRTSLWRRTPAGRWQIFHHQGTLAPQQEAPADLPAHEAAGAVRRSSYDFVAAAMRWWLNPASVGSFSAARAANRICSRRCGSAHSWRSGQPGPSTP
jgi:hypothetical protein